jgi:hypothetical protein
MILIVVWLGGMLGIAPIPAAQAGKAEQIATATSVYANRPLLFSLTDAQTVGGIAFADEDIIKFDGQSFSLFFDGSDVGCTSSDLFAFTLLDSDTLLLAFSTTLTLGGISVAPQDIVRFDATSLGSTTAGTFSLYFDGSDVGLTTTAEPLDAVSVLGDGRILLSTTGNPSVTGISGADEDILAFTPTSLGNTTAGAWSLYFDGSDVGLANTVDEDVEALDVAPDGAIYLSTLGSFSVTGVSGADEDIFVCMPSALGNTTACTYSAALYFDGSAWGLAANDVDAFHILASLATPTPAPTNMEPPPARQRAQPLLPQPTPLRLPVLQR